jgi:hypothetical protein
MRQIKQQALQARQSPMEKGYTAAENFLKFAGTARGLWDVGRSVYAGAQAVAPYARAAATAISLL